MGLEGFWGTSRVREAQRSMHIAGAQRIRTGESRVALLAVSSECHLIVANVLNKRQGLILDHVVQQGIFRATDCVVTWPLL